MKTRPQRNFSPGFRLEAAQLVIDQNYTVREAADAMSVGYSTMDRWVRQLRQERNGETSKATPMTPDQLKIRELEKRRCSGVWLGWDGAISLGYLAFYELWVVCAIFHNILLIFNR